MDELEKTLDEIYKSSPQYFKSEHIETHTHKEYIKQWYENKKEQEKREIEEQSVKVIMRQTDYTKEQALESLNRNGNIEKCIEEYLGVTKKHECHSMSTNQAIYKSIREWMK